MAQSKSTSETWQLSSQCCAATQETAALNLFTTEFFSSITSVDLKKSILF